MQGGSNGGLLMGAQITQVRPPGNTCLLALNVPAGQHLHLSACMRMQRPDLYGAVISQVGVYDMLRYPLFTIGVRC